MFQGWTILVVTVLVFSTPSGAEDSTTSGQPIPGNVSTIKVGYDPAWLPFSFRDQSGALAGLDAEVLELLAAKTQLHFEPIHSSTWSNAYELALGGHVDLLTSTASTPERQEHFLFTRPYASFPLAIITRQEETKIRGLADLDGRRVAAPKDYAPTLALRRDHPEAVLLDCTDTIAAFHLLTLGQADAVVTNLVNAAHVLRQEGLNGLRVAGLGPYTLDLRLAVRRDRPDLHRVLDEAIATLTLAERQALVAPYVTLDTEALRDWPVITRRIGMASLGVLCLIGGVTWHNLRLRRELDTRRRLQNELERSNRGLKTLHEEKSGLLRMAAHDLRNPLTGLLMSLEVAKSGPPSSRLRAFQLMEEQARRMHQLVQNLLDVECLESGRRELKPERVEASSVLSECLAVHESWARKKHILLAPPEGTGWLRADRSALRQVCENLISNAVKYSPPGSTIRVRVLTNTSGRLRLTVQDQGPGLPPEDLPKLFHKFSRLSSRPTGGETSTGLGLAIVKELTERMGGRVWCETELGRGALFLVELPSAEPPASI